MNTNKVVKEIVDRAKVFVFDLDGTIYLGNNLIGNVKETFDKIRNSSRKIVYLTNNSSRTDGEYIKKLKKLKIYSKQDIFYSSLDCAADYILKNLPDKKIYALADKKVNRYLARHGIKLSEKADAVLITFDKHLTYKKIATTNRLLLDNKLYIATHPDAVCPTDKESVPDLGSFIKLFELSSGRTPQIIIGKPYTFMADYIAAVTNAEKGEMVMFGDRLNTDIAFAKNSGMRSVLVLTGEATEKDLETSDVLPDAVTFSVNDVADYL